MARHMFTTHGSDKQFLYPKCMQESTTQTDLNRNWRGEDGTTRYTCDMCGISMKVEIDHPRDQIARIRHLEWPKMLSKYQVTVTLARNQTSALNVGTVIGTEVPCGASTRH
ncbi:uncharacterized protein LOC128212857 [Mya arenaria]|uniref:uncharacterized protein LOC128212857 n=1 Tax=Mya arenaria TaxID=6604 RepID=UPI0022E68B74|nr:uncharacterized protein LOC128212857 [Mya arenaria]